MQQEETSQRGSDEEMNMVSASIEKEQLFPDRPPSGAHTIMSP